MGARITPSRLSEAAVGVLGSAPVGTRVFRRSSGTVTDEVVAEYIRLAVAEPADDDRFQISQE